MSLDPKVKEFALGLNFGVVTTINPDGQPIAQPVWIDADDDHLLINTEKHRRKTKNVEREPRVVVTILDQSNPYDYVEVRGRVVEIIEDESALEHIHQLARKYTGQDYDTSGIQSHRVIWKIAPNR